MLKIYITKILGVIAPRLLVFYRSLKENYEPLKEFKITTQGFKFIGNDSMMAGTFEHGETAVFEKIIKHVDIVVNVGANVGYYSCIALNLNKRVIAFEPMPTNIRTLLANIHANNWESKIEIFPLALSDKTGVVEMFGEGTGASLINGWAGLVSGKTTLVPTSTLDQ